MRKIVVCALFFTLAHCKMGNQENSASNRLRAEILDVFKNENGGQLPSERMASGEANPADAAFVELKDFLFSGGFATKLREGSSHEERGMMSESGEIRFQYNTADLKTTAQTGENQSFFDKYQSLYESLSSKNLNVLIRYEEALKKSKPIAKTPESVLNHPEYDFRDSEGNATHAYLLDYYSQTLDGKKTLVVAFFVNGNFEIETLEDTPRKREYYSQSLGLMYGIEGLKVRSQARFPWHTLENLELKTAVEFCRNDARFEVKVDLPERAYILAGGNILMNWPVYPFMGEMGGMGGAGGPRHENNDADHESVDGHHVDDDHVDGDHVDGDHAAGGDPVDGARAAGERAGDLE